MRGVEMKKIGVFLVILCIVILLTAQFGVFIFSAIIFFLIGGIVPGTDVVLSSTTMLIGSIGVGVVISLGLSRYIFLHYKRNASLSYAIGVPLFVSRRDVHRHSH
jgi:hypothetical protein